MLYRILRPLGVLFYKIFYRVKIFGKEKLIKKGKCIVVCNHLGKMDVFTVATLYPDKTYFLSKKEWFDNKPLGWLIDKLGAIPIDRDKPSIKTIKTALNVLKENKRLGIFPEGRRNFETNELQEIKHGTALFAVKGKALITPVIIYDRLKKFRQNYAIIGDPLDFSEFYDVKFSEDVEKQCTERISEAMHGLQRELFKKVAAINEEKAAKKAKKIKRADKPNES